MATTYDEYTPEAAQKEWGITRQVIEVARTFQYDEKHTNQVLALAIRLFYELMSLHNLGDQEKLWLKWAALLHDIGWVEGRKEHHKIALRIILTTPLLPFDSKERLIVGSIARYHRKALPDPSHDHFKALDEEEQDKVLKLAALLRLADGLDGSHEGLIRWLDCNIKEKKVIVYCRVEKDATEDGKDAKKKSDLFKQVYGKRVEIRWNKVDHE